MCDKAQQAQPKREWMREQEALRDGCGQAGQIIGGANAGSLNPLQTPFDAYHRRVASLAQHNVEAAEYQLEAAKEAQQLLSLLDSVPANMKALVGEILQRSSSARHFKL